MGFCQWVVVILMALGLLINLAKDGEQRHEDYDFVKSCGCTAIWFILLYFGGFFN